MSLAHRRYVAVETAVSVVINIILSGAFTWLFFGGRTSIAYAGPHGYGVDVFPQTFAIALMSVLVPSLLTRKRLASGKAQPLAGAGWLPARLVLRAPLLAVAATTLLGGGFYGLGQFGLPQTVTVSTLLAIKLVYGALVAVVVTPIGLIAALKEPARPVATDARPGQRLA
ncbi:hypothetical protein [Caulobacter hibisci]|uniref:Uncharacterized protein n=1 Tax=Caulobacter hibisci TaxID=2035993 RepID=A0ABS0SWU3_9CAUL|nr:hypothetical protein [Caulobacter hibisci]MBI1684095.1 hypothetical protein [Caulobacter hibisci]